MTSDREAEPVALALAGQGFNVFVLRYSVAPKRFPTQILEVSRALWLIRQNAEKWNVDTDQVAVMGFSAGGHLAASIGVLWNSSMISDTLKQMPQGANKPNKLILCYPVISSAPEIIHRGSFELHVYPDGPHGISLCDERSSKTPEQNNAYVARWFDNLVAWLKR